MTPAVVTAKAEGTGVELRTVANGNRVSVWLDWREAMTLADRIIREAEPLAEQGMRR